MYGVPYLLSENVENIGTTALGADTPVDEYGGRFTENMLSTTNSKQVFATVLGRVAPLHLFLLLDRRLHTLEFQFANFENIDILTV